MKETLKYTISLPFFPGFNETIISSTDMLDSMFESPETYKYFIDEYGIDFSKDDIEIDEAKYQKYVCELYIKNFSKYLPKYVKSIKFSELYKQKEYNFENDRLYVDIEYKENYRKELLKFIDNIMMKQKNMFIMFGVQEMDLFLLPIIILIIG